MEAESPRFFSYNANFDAHLTRGDGRFKAMAGNTYDYGLYPLLSKLGSNIFGISLFGPDFDVN